MTQKAKSHRGRVPSAAIPSNNGLSRMRRHSQLKQGMCTNVVFLEVIIVQYCSPMYLYYCPKYHLGDVVISNVFLCCFMIYPEGATWTILQWTALPSALDWIHWEESHTMGLTWKLKWAVVIAVLSEKVCLDRHATGIVCFLRIHSQASFMPICWLLCFQQ